MTLKPINNNVAVKLLKVEEKTSSGLYIPKEQEKNKGEIIAKDEAVEFVALGDIIIFNKHRGEEIEIDSEKIIIINKDDILALL